jgi:hypothetical protein
MHILIKLHRGRQRTTYYERKGGKKIGNKRVNKQNYNVQYLELGSYTTVRLASTQPYGMLLRNHTVGQCGQE